MGGVGGWWWLYVAVGGCVLSTLPHPLSILPVLWLPRAPLLSARWQEAGLLTLLLRKKLLFVETRDVLETSLVPIPRLLSTPSTP